MMAVDSTEGRTLVFIDDRSTDTCRNADCNEGEFSREITMMMMILFQLKKSLYFFTERNSCKMKKVISYGSLQDAVKDWAFQQSDANCNHEWHLYVLRILSVLHIFNYNGTFFVQLIDYAPQLWLGSGLNPRPLDHEKNIGPIMILKCSTLLSHHGHRLLDYKGRSVSKL